MEENVTIPENDKLSSFKKIVFKTGLFVTVSFILRLVAGLLINGLYSLFEDTLSPTALYILHLMLSGICLQIAPSLIGAGMFGFFRNKCEKLKAIYKIPPRCIKAVGNFAAVYGMGQIANILTMLVTVLITHFADLNDSFNTVTSLQPPDMTSAWFLLFTLVVIAPVFEEFIFRGVLMDSLKPYGNGFAVFVTGILFGLYHGNFSQFFYTAVIGIALGYIANVTGSIFPTTIIHAIFNSISGMLLLLMTTPSVQEYVMSGSTEAIPDGDMIIIVFFGLFMVSALVLMLAGIVCAVMKIKQIKKYKVPAVWNEISNGKKTAMLLLTVPSVIAVLLIIDTFAGFSDMLIAKLF